MSEWKALSGKRCLVTGGSSGIGYAIVKLLHDAGAHVLTCARGAERLETTLADIGKTSGRLHGVCADVSQPPDLDMLFDAVDRRLGGLDILIANAAVAGEGVTDMKEADVQKVLAINLFGQIACVRRGIARMEEGGRIVLLGSMSADIREEEGNVYVATKAGLQGFAEALRKAVNKRGLHVHLIEPGAVATPLHALNERELEVMRERREMLTAEEVADCVAFILTRSSACDVVNLQVRPHKQFI
jgi:NAD(P)-dependent dehydrogenase (short-subunit alcohol dehydrogenase family)